MSLCLISLLFIWVLQLYDGYCYFNWKFATCQRLPINVKVRFFWMGRKSFKNRHIVCNVTVLTWEMPYFRPQKKKMKSLRRLIGLLHRSFWVQGWFNSTDLIHIRCILRHGCYSRTSLWHEKFFWIFYNHDVKHSLYKCSSNFYCILYSYSSTNIIKLYQLYE